MRAWRAWRRPAVLTALARSGWHSIITAAAIASAGGRPAVVLEAAGLTRPEITICASSARILNSLIWAAASGPCGTAAVSLAAVWTALTAVIALVTAILVAAALATAGLGPGGGLVKLVRVLCSHVPRRHNYDDKDYHDNNCKDDHELSHHTIQRGMASWCGAGEAHAAIDAGLSRLRKHPGSIK
ncbi:MAG TPA: hypothetical protein VGJ50_06430 [Streptosporangiaceae bacterium]